jgi:hypothetical protein
VYECVCKCVCEFVCASDCAAYFFFFGYLPRAIDRGDRVSVAARVLQQVHQVIARDDTGGDNFVQRGHGEVLFCFVLLFLSRRLALTVGLGFLASGDCDVRTGLQLSRATTV